MLKSGASVKLNQLQRQLAATERERDLLVRERSELRRALEEQRVVAHDAKLRHALSAACDFHAFRITNLQFRDNVGAEYLCAVHVPAWCVESGASDADADAAPTEVTVRLKVLATAGSAARQHKFAREHRALLALPPHAHLAPLLLHSTRRLPNELLERLSRDLLSMLQREEEAPFSLALVTRHYAQSLREAVMAEGALEGAQVLSWCMEIASAVTHLWHHGWVHLALTPDSAAIDGRRALLTDLGAALPVGEDGRSVAVPLDAAVTMRLAPEVHEAMQRAREEQGGDAVAAVTVDGGRQGVWALGVLMHELVVGARPLAHGGQGHGVVVAEARLLERGMSAEMVRLLGCMVCTAPAERPADPVEAYRLLLSAWEAAGAAADATDSADPAAAAGASDPSDAADAAPPSLPDVERALHASLVNVSCDAVSGKAVPNAVGRQLAAWGEGEAGVPEEVAHAARLSMAWLLWWGEAGMRQDRARAGKLAAGSLPWCRDAAKRGVAFAQRLLGACCADGIGVHVNWREAVQWYGAAAQQGNVWAARSIGMCYELGKGVPANAGQAVQWYLHAADKGLPAAQLNLGCCYELGRGVSVDMREAMGWYREAAERGLAAAQWRLGTCYAGKAATPDMAEAVEWWRQAAEQGHVEAQRALHLQAL